MTQLFYDSGKLRVRVCGGINCSGGGGGQVLVSAFEQALQEAGVADQVDVYRSNCLGECPNGPCVRIGTDRFYHIQKEDVPMLVKNEILPRL